MRAALAVAVVALGVVAVGCASEQPSSPFCTCAPAERFDGAQCVAADAFVAPTDCTDEGTPVCGCDGQTYTGACAARTLGVQIQYAGNCRAATGGGGGGGGGGGW